MTCFRSLTRSPVAVALPRLSDAPALPMPPEVFTRVLRRIALDGLTLTAMNRPGCPVGVDFAIRTRAIPVYGLRAAMLHLISHSAPVRNDPARLDRCRALLRSAYVR
jgi:hypothetical protein